MPHHAQTVFAALTALITAAPLAAQNAAEPAAAEPVVDATPPALATSDESEYRLVITPYIWMASLSGDIGVRGTQFDASKNFIDIVRDSDVVFGLMGQADLEVNRWVFQFNGAWSLTEVKDANATTPSGTVDADVTTNSGWFELFGGYRIFDEPLGRDADANRRVALDLFAGGRITTVNTDIDLRAASDLTLADGTFVPANTSADLDSSESWFEPFVGARATFRLTERWVIQFRGDVGGFDVDDSKFAWQAMGAIGYWWRTEDYDIGLFGGYRALGQDYDSGDFVWDMTTHGPVIGAAFSFKF